MLRLGLLLWWVCNISSPLSLVLVPFYDPHVLVFIDDEGEVYSPWWGFFFSRIELRLSLLLPCLLNLGVDNNCSLSYNWVESSIQISICEVLSPFPHLNSMFVYNNYLVCNDQFILKEMFLTNSWDGGFHVIVSWVLLNFQYRKCQ